MAKLYEIKGYWNEEDNWRFNDEKMWTGQIVKERDGWFEGITIDKNGEKRFIFGVYDPEEFLDLWLIRPAAIEDSLYYKCAREHTNGYYGEARLTGFPALSDPKICNCYFEIQESKNQDKSELLGEIANWKHVMHDDESILFYEDYESNRSNVVESAQMSHAYRLSPEQREIVKKMMLD